MLEPRLEVYQRISICSLLGHIHHAMLFNSLRHVSHGKQLSEKNINKEKDNAAESSSPRVRTLIACRAHEFQ